MSAAPLHCILVTIGSSGDVHPFVGLGLALKRRGHQVTLSTGSYFEPLVRSAGLDFEPLFDSDRYLGMLDDPDLWHPRRAPKFVMQNAVLPFLRPGYETVKRLYEPGRTVVATSSLALGPRVAEEKLGVPTATIHLQPAMIRSAIRPPRIVGMLIGPRVPPWLVRAQYWLADRLVVDRILEQDWNGFRRELGLPPVRRLFQDYVHAPRLTIGLFPEWYAPPRSDWPAQVRLTGFPLYDESDLAPLDDELQKFLAAGPPPIAFTAGSAMTHGQAFFAAAAAGCARFGHRGLLLTKYPEQLPSSLPPGVRHVRYAPFSQLLPRCAAVVQHGGIGSTAQSLAAGIPQLVVPLAHDQFDNAERVVGLGVGYWMSRKEFESGLGAAVLNRMIDAEKYHKPCQRYASLLGRNTALDDTAKLLEGLVAPR
jgi:UDP:flavonoid glycosyltransferase YjiC (YdhE family)